MMGAAVLGGCSIYKPYSRPEINTEGLYRDVEPTDSASIATVAWDELFTDTCLQALIREGLAQNTDLRIARTRVEAAKAVLLGARLSYLPSLSLNADGGLSSIDGSKPAKTYNLAGSASWEIDLFGGILNTKRAARAALEQSEAYQQMVQTQVVASIATYYYTLLMLDKQLEITEATAILWKENVETMKHLKEAGSVNEAGVVQSEANYYSVVASVADLKDQIRQTENALSLLLRQAPQQIDRGTLDEQVLPEEMNVGVPIQLLSNRPDVKVAEMALAGTYYNANEARAAFYPSITLTGSAGWTNSAGGAIINPGKVLLSALGSLTQPLFYRGANIARLKIAKAQQEEAMLSFEQTILNAGSEVSNALSQYETASQKLEQRILQINSLEKSVEYTQKLLTFGTSTYLEVLTAQQSLLSAQLSGVSDQYSQMQAVVTLYRALGGGVK